MKTSALALAAAAAAAQAQMAPGQNVTYDCAKPNANYCMAPDIILRCDANSKGTPGRCTDNLSGYPPIGGLASCWESAKGAGDAACEKNCVVYAEEPFTLESCVPSYTATETSPAPTHPYPNTTLTITATQTTTECTTTPPAHAPLPSNTTWYPSGSSSGFPPGPPGNSTGRPTSPPGTGEPTNTPQPPTSTSVETPTAAAIANKAGGGLLAAAAFAAAYLA